ncbi:MAG TPA: hypothetical protein VGI75_03895, partial [Pirellulales bacterium]
FGHLKYNRAALQTEAKRVWKKLRGDSCINGEVSQCLTAADRFYQVVANFLRDEMPREVHPGVVSPIRIVASSPAAAIDRR